MFHAAALQLLRQYFLSPVGLLALLALIPLAIFYLMRPDPDERVMPSMQFFLEEERSGRLQQSFHLLQRNFVLLLHVLFIGGVAAALAGPYVTGEDSAEHAVVVVDRSASMADDMDDVTSFVAEHAGKRNTLVVVGEQVSVPLEEVGKQRLIDRVKQVEPGDVETDIRAGLEVASSYDGAAVVASDLDQSVGGGNAGGAVERLATGGRDVAVMDTAAGNEHGIVDIVPARGNSTVDVKNFLSTSRDITVSAGDATATVTVPGGAVETVTVPTPAGQTEISLPGDPVPADNAAYVSVPPAKEFSVVHIADRRNPYLASAVGLINFTTYRHVQPPLNRVPSADVYVIGAADRLLQRTVDRVEEEVRAGAGAVVVAHGEVFDMVDAIPVTRTGQRRNVTVEIQEPRRVMVGDTAVFPVRRTGGEQLATHNALVAADHGRGEMVLYNLDDRDFRFHFLYPVFWKDLLDRLTGRPAVAAWNRETGTSLNRSVTAGPSGITGTAPVRLESAGFYRTGSATYTANLVSADESGEEDVSVDQGAVTGETQTQRPLKHLAALALLLLALGEFGYLRYRGSV